MKPVHERNQECLPPKKRDLPVNTTINTSSSISSGAGASGLGCGGTEENPSSQSSGTSGEPQSRSDSGEWLQAHPGVHYGVEGSEGLVGLSVDEYNRLYKVTLPCGTYSPTSLHPVLSHISPAYTVPSPVLQHTSVPYPQLGYTQIPHSSLQFVSSPFAAAVPYALPPGFVPSPLIPPQLAIPQPHPVSHLVPYSSVIQKGVVSSPQQQVSTHSKMPVPDRVPLVVPSEQVATQAQLGAVGMLFAGELNPKGVNVFNHPSVRGVQPLRDIHSSPQEREVNGGNREHGGRESLKIKPDQDSVYLAGVETLKYCRQEGRVSPGQCTISDTDLEVQQVVGRLAFPSQATSRKDAAHIPLNLSHRPRETQRDVSTAYASNPSESRAHQQQIVQQGHAVILANGQPVLVPVDYHHHQQPQLQQHYSSQPNDVAATASPKTNPNTKAADATAAVCVADQVVTEPSLQLPVPTAGAVPQTPLLASAGPSHFMKGAIIQLATGELKRVEDLQTQDFVRSAEMSGGLKIDSSMVVDIRSSQQRPGLVALHFSVGEQQSKLTIDVPPEHPFFVFGQGWSSCSPERTAHLYGLACHHLQVGDVCVSVTLQQQAAQQQKPQQQLQARTLTKANSTSGATPQPMAPPAPQYTRPQNQLKVERIHKERDKEEPIQVSGSRHSDVPPRLNRTSAEHTRSQSNYYLHIEGHAAPGTGAGASCLPSQRRWSAPGFQRYSIKNKEGNLASAVTSCSSRPSFISQEVKLSIEGRSNAGK